MLPLPMEPLLILATIVALGTLGGELARRLKLPSLTGNILAGVLIGPVFHLVDPASAVAATSHITAFAMTMIAAVIGAHLSYHRIHNALKRIAMIGIGETFATLFLVAGVLFLWSGDLAMSLLLGVLATTTAPATILHIVRENRAKGPVVKTVLAVVAVDNILAIALFALVVNMLAVFVYSEPDQGKSNLLLHLLPLWNLGGAVVLGIVLGRLAEYFILRPRHHNFSIVFIALLVAAGLSRFILVSPLLTSLVFGVYMANRSPRLEEKLNVLEPITPIVFIGFFTMAGVNLHVSALVHAGGIGLLYVLLRMVGKYVGGAIGGILAGTSPRVWQNTALALMPQAGLVIALTLIVSLDQRLPADLRNTVSTIVLAAVVVSEILGSILTRLALMRAGEQHKDRRRLVEFLQEEYIKIDLQAHDKWQAILELTDFFRRTHRVGLSTADLIRETVVEREHESNTAIGYETALPHGRIENGNRIQGVLGIAPHGIHWDGPDQRPVKLIMLIVTPTEHQTQHLAVLAVLAAMVKDEALRARLITSATAEEAWSLIEHREKAHENEFLED